MYTLLFKSPCRLPSPEGISYYYAGDVLEVEDSDYDFLEANFQNYFIMMGYTDSKKTQPKQTKKTEVKTEVVEIPVIHTAGVPLAEDAHWQEVKAYVLKLEEEVPIDLKAVAEVKVKFSNYASVVKECERILANNNAIVK